MKLITRNTDYAVRALCFIASNREKLVTVPGLVKELKIPLPFLRKLMQALNRNGILKSYKGKRGGFVLAKPLDKIFLVDLMEIFQGPFKLNECLFKKRICPDVKICMLNRKLNEIEKHVVNDLSSINLASLMG